MKAIILYASITGNAKGMARIEQQFFEHYGWDVTLGEMIQTDPTTIKRYDVLVLATYTWTGGVIPEETEDFYEDLSKLDFSAKPLVFGVLGTGDPYYGKDYNTAPELFEAVLAASGAVQGADPVKIALNVKQEEMPQFAAFTKSLIAKAEALQADK